MPVALAYEAFIRAWRRPGIRSFLRPLFPARACQGYVFLVGCYNSGTTVVKDAIALHPDVVSMPVEGDVLTSALDTFERGGWPRGMYGLAPEILMARKSGPLDRGSIESDWRPWLNPNRTMVEKSIAHSVRIEQLRQAFPRSRFICITRSPTAVVRGIIKRSHPVSEASWILGQQYYDEAFLWSQWHFIYQLILEDAEQDDTLFCAYEDFISSPAEVLTGLFDFLALPQPELQFSNNHLTVAQKSLYVRPHAESLPPVGDAKAFLVGALSRFKSVPKVQAWLPESS